MSAPAVPPLDAVRALLAGHPAWIVGGAVRDRLLGRATTDLDLVLPGDPRATARALADRTGGAAFRLSGAFGAWRVVGPQHAWHVDLVALREQDIEADLGARDFTINAMAEPLEQRGGELLDPHGGRADLQARRLRMVGPGALADDPLRTLRAVRLATELDLTIEPATAGAIEREAPGLQRVAAERIFGELKQLVRSPALRTGLALMEAHGITAQVLPELLALHGVEQNVFHHADVHDHTLEVLEQVRAIELDPLAAGFGEHAAAVAALLREPLADGLTRGDAMRLAALLHDAAKPWTRIERAGRVGFPGHDREGAEVARTVLRRLRASERLVEQVAALCLHHLRLGFLVHERPLGRRTVWRYLQATEPYAVDVTVFTVADRLATRGRNAGPATTAHVELARALLGPALERRAHGRRAPLIRGDDLVRELGLRPGRRLGELLAQLEEDRFAGAIATPEEALRRARELDR